MAKRKRLTPAQQGFLDPGDSGAPVRRPAPGPLPPAPIAQVAGEASATAALSELSAAMTSARAEGRLIETLPLEAIDAGYLVRDRLVQDGDDMAALITSLAARGQQTPIEVVRLEAPRGGCTHGLVSGWRRLSALRRLRAEHPGPQGDRFGTIQARIIAPDNRQAAYVAMVEENEIRADLSHYERARIVLRAREEGVYPTQKTALQGLFGAVSRSKRSKINSFVPLVIALDKLLKFPAAIPEKLGLELSRAVQDDPGFPAALKARLSAPPVRNAGDERDRLAAAVKAHRRPRSAARTPAPPPAAGAVASGGEKGAVTLRFDESAGRIELSGPGVGPALVSALQGWLDAR